MSTTIILFTPLQTQRVQIMLYGCMDRDIKASKNILGLLLNQYRGEERPVCFRPEKIAVKPRKSDKRAKACDSPLIT